MRLWAACLGLVTLVACTSWHMVDLTPAEYMRGNEPEVIRLTRSDNSHISLRAPVLRGDTIVGLAGAGSEGGTARQVKVPLSSVSGLAVPQFSGAKSAVLTFLFTIPVAIAGCTSGTGPFC